jgi:hypothetical protein
MIVIVPESLRVAIDAKLDAALAECPGAAPDRPVLFEQLLAHFNEHGEVPEFTLEKGPPRFAVGLHPKGESEPDEFARYDRDSITAEEVYSMESDNARQRAYVGVAAENARVGWDSGFAQRCHDHLLAITTRDRLVISEEQRVKDVRDVIALVAELDRQLAARVE